jgi:hypothetical protein
MTATARPSSAPPSPVHITVTVTYNGLSRDFPVTSKQASRSLLEHALQAFGVQNNAHIHSLFTTAGVELTDSQSLEDAGVVDKATLLLRPSTIRGGVA